MVASSKMAAHQRWIVFVVEDHNKASGLGDKTPNGADLAEGHSRQAVFRSTSRGARAAGALSIKNVRMFPNTRTL